MWKLGKLMDVKWPLPPVWVAMIHLFRLKKALGMGSAAPASGFQMVVKHCLSPWGSQKILMGNLRNPPPDFEISFTQRWCHHRWSTHCLSPGPCMGPRLGIPGISWIGRENPQFTWVKVSPNYSTIIYPLVMTNSLLLKMAPIEIVDLPSYKIVIFNSYVSLPEGTNDNSHIFETPINPHQINPKKLFINSYPP